MRLPFQLPNTKSHAPALGLQKAFVSAMVSACLLSGGPQTEPALAAPLSPEQELVAQAWLKADRGFVDRTFNDQDWFSRRQKMVKKKYDGREEAYAEIRSMLSSLNDKYTRFLTPSMYEAVYSVATGDVAGIGIELATTSLPDGKEAVSVSTVVEGAPSDQAGLKPGDILEEADGTVLRGLSPEEAAAKVRGPVGSKLRLVVRRAGEEEPLIKLITRATVKLEGVTSSMESAGGQKVGFIRIKQFSTSTVDDVKAALEKLRDASTYVLDLRGNTGGYFPGGVDVARLFLKAETPITFVIDKRQQETAYQTFEDGAFSDKPLVLLVDDKTASASEILSSALQDNGRAKLVGSQPKTFGKAVIQTVENLDDGSAVVVTIAQYQTPKRTNINQRGIEVDLQKECPGGKAAVACIERDLKTLTAR